MKTVNLDKECQAFLDKKQLGKVFFGVYVGSGQPQRLYPETTDELRECLSNVRKSGLNPGLGDLYPPSIR